MYTGEQWVTPGGPGPKRRLGWAKGLGIVVAVAVVGGGTAWVVVSMGAGEEPAASPGASLSPGESPTAGADASPTANPDASPVITVAPGEVTAVPGLPAAQPLPDGIWSETGPGWILTTYLAANSPDTGQPQAAVLYLVDPAGTFYQVLELAPDRLDVKAWDAGSTVALVEPCCDGELRSLDLLTGDMTAAPGDLAGIDGVTAVSADGRAVGFRRGEPDVQVIASASGTVEVGQTLYDAEFSPDGHYVATQGEVYDTSTGAQVRAASDLASGAEHCFYLSWWDSATLSAKCVTQPDPMPQEANGNNPRLILVDVASGAMTRDLDFPSDGDRAPVWVALDAGDAGALVLVGPTSSAELAGAGHYGTGSTTLLKDGAFRYVSFAVSPAGWSSEVRAAAGNLYLRSWGGDSGDGGGSIPEVVYRYDPGLDLMVVLLPSPRADAPESAQNGLMSFFVAP